MRFSDTFRCGLFLVCVWVLAVGDPLLMDAAQQQPTQIIFDDQFDIFVMDSDGANVKQLIRSPGGKTSRDAVWSPDKKRIAFVSDRDGPREIYVGDADGTNIRRLTQTAGSSLPEWSPDGARIAFSAAGQVWVIGADGSDLRSLTLRELNASFPSWSPDGRKIGFATGQTGNRNVYVMNMDGSDARPLTHRTVGSVGGIAWSPDGQEILFDAGPGRQGPWDIWVIGTDGSNERQLTSTPDGKYSSRGVWSPDGRSIAFHSNRDCATTGLIGKTP